MNISIISLGCPRNTVDSEKYLKLLEDKGFRSVEPEKAHAILINTCGFIEEAKKESIAVIRRALELKKKGRISKVIVFGCLVKRYAFELKKHLKGVDAYIDIVNSEEPERQSLECGHSAYLKISEGCSNLCSYCAIPLIRGKLHSRSPESILQEVRFLDASGVKELSLIAQDITSWGKDVKGGKDLVWLIGQILTTIKNIRWIRLLYTHPRFLSKPLIDLIAGQEKICNYIDIPLQHINDRILKRMNRKITRSQIEAKLRLLRAKIPDIAIRTSFMVGFPSESDKDFFELLAFVSEQRFANAGAFIYSQEEKTKASRWKQVPDKTKRSRFDALMKAQQKISLERNKTLVGNIFDVIIDETAKDHSLCRAYFQAREIDTTTTVNKRLKTGTFAKVRITEAYEYDLVAELI
ncbi:MiaB/RimO family radical SAM methylthiotransferase [Candidatus Omnitrophota bacterium]